MYEEFFGLSKRPFSAIPSADYYVSIPTADDALESLIHCVSHARGIAVVTSGAGLGKTLVCKRLASILSDRFRAVFLSTSGFHTRRALLQAVLYELGEDYVGLSEQEARLRIFQIADSLDESQISMLIIADEAHLMNLRMFEELRTLADHTSNGKSSIRLVLAGQFELEEKLTDPALSAFNQRIGTHVIMEPLSLQDSADFVLAQLKWAGCDEPETVITESALEAICRASDGNMRCLSQLSDHSFLLGYAEECCPIDEPLVRLALRDVQELPLNWADLGAAPEEVSTFESTAELDAEMEVFEPSMESITPQQDSTESCSSEWDAIEETNDDTAEFDLADLARIETIEAGANRAISDGDGDDDDNVEWKLDSQDIGDHLAEIDNSPSDPGNNAAEEKDCVIEFAVLEIGGPTEVETGSSEDVEDDLVAMNDADADQEVEQRLETEPVNPIESVPMMKADEMVERPVRDLYAALDRAEETGKANCFDLDEAIEVSIPEMAEQELVASVNDDGRIILNEVDVPGSSELMINGLGSLNAVSEVDTVEANLLASVATLHQEVARQLDSAMGDVDLGCTGNDAAERSEWIEYDVVQPMAIQSESQYIDHALETDKSQGYADQIDRVIENLDNTYANDNSSHANKFDAVDIAVEEIIEESVEIEQHNEPFEDHLSLDYNLNGSTSYLSVHSEDDSCDERNSCETEQDIEVELTVADQVLEIQDHVDEKLQLQKSSLTIEQEGNAELEACEDGIAECHSESNVDSEAESSSKKEQGRFAMLFSRLRRRRRKLMAEPVES